MKKTIVLLLFILIIPFHVSAELSSNLDVKTVMNWQTKSLVDRKTYVDSKGNPVVPDDKGYATIKYTYKMRKIVREEFLDEHNKLVNCVDGYAYKVNLYSIENYLTGCEYHDVNGKLVNGPDGYASQKITYFHGYHKSTWNYDAEGKPVGWHRVSEYKQYSKKRFLVTSDTWYDPDGNLTAGPNGYARIENEYEGKTKSKVAYIAADGSLFYDKNARYAKMDSVYKNGKIQSTHYYGKNNELIAGPKGYAYIIYSYPKGYETEKYYNADGTPYYNDQGVCGIGTIKKGNYQKEIFYYTGENQRGSCIDGYFKTQIYTNSRGKTTIQSYFDADGQLMIVERLGYAKCSTVMCGGKLQIQFVTERTES